MVSAGLSTGKGVAAIRRTRRAVSPQQNVRVDDAEPRVEPETAAIRRLQTAMAEAEVALAQRLALNPTDLAALAQITWSNTDIDPSTLAQFLNISPGGDTEVIDRLTSAGYVERRRDMTDRRRVRLQPSEKAAGIMYGHDAIDTAARGSSEADRRGIMQFLERVIGAYSAWAQGTSDPTDGGK